MYNKTTLKKIKKDELVQMYLDLQAKRLDEKMDEALEKCCTNAIDETVEELKDQNERLENLVQKLKEQLKKGGQAHMKDKKAYDINLKIRESELDAMKEVIDKLKEKDKEWTELMKDAMSSGLTGKVEKLTEENESLKEEINQN